MLCKGKGGNRLNTWILMPDSFKGTMSSQEVCTCMKEQILRHVPGANVISIPVADGGEGSVDCFLQAVNGEKVTVEVQGPYAKPMQAYYGILHDGTAVVEMAACAGLPLVGEQLCPDKTTTFGVGQLMLDAAQSADAEQIIRLWLGGSCTNDAGRRRGSRPAARSFTDKRRAEAFAPAGGHAGRCGARGCLSRPQAAAVRDGARGHVRY